MRMYTVDRSQTSIFIYIIMYVRYTSRFQACSVCLAAFGEKVENRRTLLLLLLENVGAEDAQLVRFTSTMADR